MFGWVGGGADGDGVDVLCWVIGLWSGVEKRDIKHWGVLRGGKKNERKRSIPEYLCRFAHLVHHQEADESLSLSLANCIFFLHYCLKRGGKL